MEIRSKNLLTFVPVLALMLVLSLPVGAQAPSAPPVATPVAAPAAEPSTEALEKLAATLRDDAQRQKFLDTLETLLTVRREQEKPALVTVGEVGLSDRVARMVSENVGALSSRLSKVVGVLRQAPRLIPLFETQIMEPAKRDRVIGLVWRFLVIVGLGMAVQYLFRRTSNGVRRRLETVPGEQTVLVGVLRFTGRTVLLYLNACAYGAGAYGAYAALPMPGPSSAVLLVGASAFFVAKLILATARVFLSPGVAGLRPGGGMSDETANYLYLWVRRLVRVFVYAFFFLEAMRLVGLPGPAHESLLYLTGLAFCGFLVVFVLQNRASVADAIRGPEGAARGPGAGVRARLAGVWHLVAFVYIAAVYLVWLFKVPGGFEFVLISTGWSLLLLVVAKVLLVGVDRGLTHLLKVEAALIERLPGLEARANRYMPVLRGLLNWVIYIAATLLVLDVWGVDTLGWLASPAGAALIHKALIVFVILFISLIVWESVNVAINRYILRLDGDGKDSARVRTLLPLMRTTLMVVLSAFAGLIILSELGVNIAPLLAGAGVLGLAIGFGSQKLVQDVITGLFILVEDTLAVGDVVRFDADHSGVVEALSIRTVKLRDLAGNVHTLPFSEVKTVLNMTKEFSYYLLDVGIAYREDVDRVIAVLRELGYELCADPEYGEFITEPLEVLGLDQFGDSAIIVRARLRIQPPIKQWAVGREFNRRMKARFDKEGIEIPFPHRTIYFGEDSAGKVRPLRVQSTD